MPRIRSRFLPHLRLRLSLSLQLPRSFVVNILARVSILDLFNPSLYVRARLRCICMYVWCGLHLGPNGTERGGFRIIKRGFSLGLGIFSDFHVLFDMNVVSSVQAYSCTSNRRKQQECIQYYHCITSLLIVMESVTERDSCSHVKRANRLYAQKSQNSFRPHENFVAEARLSTRMNVTTGGRTTYGPTQMGLSYIPVQLRLKLYGPHLHHSPYPTQLIWTARTYTFQPNLYGPHVHHSPVPAHLIWATRTPQGRSG